MVRQRISSGNRYEEAYGYSRAVRVDDRVIVAGTAPIAPAGIDVPPDAAGQARLVCSIIVAALKEAGARADEVVRTRMYITDAADGEQVGLVHGEFFAAARPASTMVIVKALLDPSWKVEIEAEAILSRQSMSQHG